MKMGHIRSWAVAAALSMTGVAGAQEVSPTDREPVPMPEARAAQGLAVEMPALTAVAEFTAEELDELLAQLGPGSRGPDGPGRGVSRGPGAGRGPQGGPGAGRPDFGGGRPQKGPASPGRGPGSRDGRGPGGPPMARDQGPNHGRGSSTGKGPYGKGLSFIHKSPDIFMNNIHIWHDICAVIGDRKQPATIA